jgi:UDP-N-acetyl-D-mannosaminuronic acid dehydrogenase
MNKYNVISMIGLGYIGLPTATVIASRGIKVIGVDVNQRIVNAINSGNVDVVEPDLAGLVHYAVKNELLVAQTTPSKADVFLIAVPTPFKDNHAPDLSFIEAAAHMIAPCLCKGNLVILESTSPVGTTEKLADWLASARPDLSFPQQSGEKADIQIAYCPERVLPGNILRELIENDRIVGGMTERAAELASDVYHIFIKGECLQTDSRTAELVKLTENAFRDVNIAFANELSLICNKHHISVWELIKLANCHPRVNILQPGPGVGGHCIAIDPWFIVDSAPKEARMIRMAREINDNKPYVILDQVTKAANKFKSPVIACLGLTFKANIEDLRESPALQIVRSLVKQKVGRILIVEPHIAQLPAELEGIASLTDIELAIEQADIVLLLVDHKQFSRVRKEKLHGTVLIDTRGLWV